MKQRITLEMLAELTEEQKERLREWWKPATGDCAVKDREEFWVYGATRDTLTFAEVDWDFEMRIDSPKKDCLPLLSIGQMLELLCSRTFRFKEIIGTGNGCTRPDNLCNELWLSIKDLL